MAAATHLALPTTLNAVVRHHSRPLVPIHARAVGRGHPAVGPRRARRHRPTRGRQPSSWEQATRRSCHRPWHGRATIGRYVGPSVPSLAPGLLVPLARSTSKAPGHTSSPTCDLHTIHTTLCTTLDLLRPRLQVGPAGRSCWCSSGTRARSSGTWRRTPSAGSWWPCACRTTGALQHAPP